MLVTLVILAFLSPAPVGMSLSGERTLRLVESTDCAGRDMEIGRYNLANHNPTGAVNRYRSVITRCPASPDAEEALAHLADLGLELGVPAISQNAVALLERKFPGGRWTIEARDKLRSAGLEAVEDEKSWIARAFR